MKTLVLPPVAHDMHHLTAEAQAKRWCANGASSENWKKLQPSVYGELRGGNTVGPLSDSRRLYKSQLVNKWLALKRRTASMPVICSPSASCGGLSSDVNGNCQVKRMRHQDRVTELPVDPRSWTPHDVGTWLRHMTESHDLEVDPSFFQMNGRGLCLMPLKGFLFRVPDHGKLMYEDFRRRLKRCLLAPPGTEARLTSGQEADAGRKASHDQAERKPRMAAVSYKGVVVVGQSSVTDYKEQMSPSTYHTL